MKFIYNLLVIIIYLVTLSAYTAEFKREGSGFSETDEFLFQNNKVIHYKNKTTWKDSLGNYGVSQCLGLIVSDVSNNIVDYKMYCNYSDQDDDQFTQKYERDTDFEAGVGQSIIISGTGKWKKHVGTTCSYAIDYLKTALFLLEKCNL